MKLHKDGTVEGTPEEIAEYNRMTVQPFPPLINEELWQRQYRLHRAQNPVMPKTALLNSDTKAE